MAEQSPQQPVTRDSRRKFLIRSARLGAAGLPLMATLHHRSALAQVCWGGESTAGSLDLSGRHDLSGNCLSQGYSLSTYDSNTSLWPVSDPNSLKVGEILGSASLIGAGASQTNVDYYDKGVKKLLADYLGGDASLEEEALSVQTYFNALNAEADGTLFAIPLEFAKELIRTLFDVGDSNFYHPYHLPVPDDSILEFFRQINA